MIPIGMDEPESRYETQKYIQYDNPQRCMIASMILLHYRQEQLPRVTTQRMKSDRRISWWEVAGGGWHNGRRSGETITMPVGTSMALELAEAVVARDLSLLSYPPKVDGRNDYMRSPSTSQTCFAPKGRGTQQQQRFRECSCSPSLPQPFLLPRYVRSIRHSTKDQQALLWHWIARQPALSSRHPLLQ